MKAFAVDTLATIVFFTLLAAATETFIAGMSPAQVLTARLVTIPIMVATARPYGVWRDWLARRLDPQYTATRIATDTAAFLSFQVPVYVFTLILSGADAGQIVLAAGSATFFMLLVGRPFGLFLDTVRRVAGTEPGPAHEKGPLQLERP